MYQLLQINLEQVVDQKLSQEQAVEQLQNQEQVVEQQLLNLAQVLQQL